MFKIIAFIVLGMLLLGTGYLTFKHLNKDGKWKVLKSLLFGIMLLISVSILLTIIVVLF